MNLKSKYFIATLLTCFLLSFNPLQAQDLEIVYDAVTDNISFYRQGKKINNPKVKQKRNMLVRVKNFNNFLLEAHVTAEAKEDDLPESSASSFNILGIVSNLGNSSSDQYSAQINQINRTSTNALGFGGNINKTTSSMPGTEDAWDDEEDDDDSFGFGGGEEIDTPTEGYDAVTFQQVQSRFNRLMEEVRVVEKEVQGATDQVVKHLNTLLLSTITSAQLEKLRLNYSLSNDVRQAAAAELVKELLQVKGDSITLRDALTFANTFETSTRLDMYNLRDTRGILATKLDELEQLKGIINALPSARNKPYMALNKTLDYNLKQGRRLLNTSDVDDEKSQDILELISEKNFPQEMTALYLQYQEVKLNAYEHTFVTTAKGDYMEITISLRMPADIADSTSEAKVLKERVIIIPVIGGVKVNSSVGVGFTSFFKKQEDYYNRDSLIIANNGDSFAPVITTLLHFYPLTSSSVSVGGNFGIGFPILGEDKSISFFLGSSILMGKSQRFVLNLGFMGGQVQRLDRGFQVGDSFGSEGEIIPTRNKYELGYFLSGTFNL